MSPAQRDEVRERRRKRLADARGTAFLRLVRHEEREADDRARTSGQAPRR